MVFNSNVIQQVFPGDYIAPVASLSQVFQIDYLMKIEETRERVVLNLSSPKCKLEVLQGQLIALIAQPPDSFINQ